MKKRALITGITGQDGSYLAELLLAKGYEVHGIVRRGSTFNTERIEHIMPALRLHAADLLDAWSIARVVHESTPLEIYHLAAPSHVGESFRTPALALGVITQGTLNVLEANRHYANAKLYVAGTSEMFGTAAAPQNELSSFEPQSPYAAAKVAAHQLAGIYRDGYGMFVARGILFNHESERRLPTFVTRKITRTLARVKVGLCERVLLGNLESRRDWGHAEDYVRAMWLMLQQDDPGDFVIGTGESHSVKDFLLAVCDRLELDPRLVAGNDYRYMRPCEVPNLRADATAAREVLGWEPAVSFDQLVDRMVAHDYQLALEEAAK